MRTPPAEENERSLVPVTPGTPFMKRVRFAGNLSGVVRCIDDPTFRRFVEGAAGQSDSDGDVSLELQEEIDSCVSQLRAEAEALFALSQKAISYEDHKTESILSGTHLSPHTLDGTVRITCGKLTHKLRGLPFFKQYLSNLTLFNLIVPHFV